MTEVMVDDALVEKVAREIAREQMPSLIHRFNRRGYVERHWMLYRDHARAAIAIAYPAGVAAGREEAAVHLEAEAAGYRHAQDNANSPGDKLYRMGQKDACLLEATAIRQRGE